MGEDSIEREIGKMQAQIKGLEKSDDEARDERQAMAKDIRAILSMLDETKGAWRVLVAVGGTMAVISSAATAVIVKWFG